MHDDSEPDDLQPTKLPDTRPAASQGARPQIMEVNSSPGLEGIEGATKLDVAGAVIDHMSNRVAFPELDVRQRLTVSTGYDVADLLIHEGAELVGKTITESGLRDKDIVVLNLHRGTSVISNPKGSRMLEAGDKLLCYGTLESMRLMIPEKRRKARKKVSKLDPAAFAPVTPR